MAKLILLCATLAGALSAGGFQLPQTAPARELLSMPEPWMAHIRRGADGDSGPWRMPLSAATFTVAAAAPSVIGQGIEATLPLFLPWSIVVRGEAGRNITLDATEFKAEVGVRHSFPVPGQTRESRIYSLRGTEAQFWIHVDTSWRWGRIAYEREDTDDSRLGTEVANGPALRLGFEYGARVCVFAAVSSTWLLYVTEGGRHVTRYSTGLELGIRFHFY